MKREEYLKLACNAGAWRRLAWRLSIFAVSIFPEDGEVELYDITYIDKLPHYWTGTGWGKIEDVPENTPIYDTNEVVNLAVEDYPGLSAPIETTAGYYVFNWVVLHFAFGTRAQYFNYDQGKDPMVLESWIYNACVTNGDDDIGEDKINSEMVGRFVQGLHELAPLAQVIAPTGTLKSLSAHPDAIRVRNELLIKYKDKLDDPAIIVLIESAMDELDKEWLSSDRSYEYYSSKKARMRRRKLLYMYGIETAFHEGADFTLIPSSLMEQDVDLDQLVVMYSSTRYGSYARGIETAKGGELVRIMLMIFHNHLIVPGDCGTKETVTVTINDYNSRFYPGLNVVEGNAVVLLTKANIKSYIGKTVKMRRAFLCDMPRPDTCETCAGGNKSEEPRATAADICSGMSNIMLSAMGAMHGRETVVTRFKPLLHIN